MEVFIQGVPERATENQLREFLLPVLTRLAIEHWHCEKRRGRRFANLTFLRNEDGNIFLSQYGLGIRISPLQNPGPVRTPLIFRGDQLSCRLSNKPPDPFMIRSLLKEASDSKRKNKSSLTQSSGATTLNHSLVSCGVWGYVGLKAVLIPYRRWQLSGTLKVGSMKLVVKMATGERIGISHSSVHAVAVEGMPHSAITLTLTEAPHFFHPQSSAQISIPKGSFGIESLRDLQLREESGRTRVPGLDAEHEVIAGHCLVYRIEVGNVPVEHLIGVLSNAAGLPPVNRCHITTLSPKRPLKAYLSDLLHALESDSTLPFPIKFQLQKLVQDGYLLPHTVLLLIREVRDLAEHFKVRTCVTAIRRPFQQLPYSSLDADARDFQLDNLIRRLRDNAAQSHSEMADYHDDQIRSEQQVLIHRVTVTPAGIYLNGPDWESKNRVLRKYPEHHDHFLRVQFCDENGLQLMFSPAASNKVIFHTRFKKVLKDGISIGGHRFSFLGFSHSSLRAQSCWFMSPFLDAGRLLYHAMLIEDLGNFSHIRSPAKCAARIGQAFPETPIAITLGKFKMWREMVAFSVMVSVRRPCPSSERFGNAFQSLRKRSQLYFKSGIKVRWSSSFRTLFPYLSI